jgi:hypothetical protein
VRIGVRVVRRGRASACAAAAIVVAVASAGLLALEAYHGVQETNQLSSTRSVDLARLDDAYYSCLAAAARRLVPPGATVWIPKHPPGAWITLAKAVAPEEPLVASRAAAVVVLRLVARSGPGTCFGRVVVATPGGAAERHPAVRGPGRAVRRAGQSSARVVGRAR